MKTALVASARLLLIPTIALLASAPAFAGGTELEAYQKDVSAFGGTVGDLNERAMCLCVNALEPNFVGYLLISLASGGSSKLTCTIPGFDVNGDVAGSTLCLDFLPLLR